jgi:hypothetical protein
MVSFRLSAMQSGKSYGTLPIQYRVRKIDASLYFIDVRYFPVATDIWQSWRTKTDTGCASALFAPPR